MTPDCLKCGLCCTSEEDRDSFVDLLDAEIARLTASQRARWVLPGGSLRTKQNKTGDCVCVALIGRLGKSVACTIYENRPEVCRRAFEPGNRRCLLLRKQYAGRLNGQ